MKSYNPSNDIGHIENIVVLGTKGYGFYCDCVMKSHMPISK